MPDYMTDDAGGCVDWLLRLIGHEQVAEWQYVLVRYKWRDLQRGLLLRTRTGGLLRRTRRGGAV